MRENINWAKSDSSDGILDETNVLIEQEQDILIQVGKSKEAQKLFSPAVPRNPTIQKKEFSLSARKLCTTHANKHCTASVRRVKSFGHRQQFT
jgi:hypothetical protein